MASTLPSADVCCSPCDEPVSVAVPGPAGTAGAAGSDGADGANAYTTTTAQFTMPAELANVTIAVGSSAPFGIAQILYVESGGAKGYFEVVTKPSATGLELKNLEDTASNAYLVNSAPATVFAIGATVSPAGLQGTAGSTTGLGPNNATYITQTPNGTLTAEQALSALATGILFSTTATGVVSIAVNGTDYYGPATPTDVPVTDGGTGSSTAAGARTNLGLVIGTNVQAWDAMLDSLATMGTAADRYFYTTGVNTVTEGVITSFARGLIDDADAAAARVTLDVGTRYGQLGPSITVDANAGATDTAYATFAGIGAYRFDKITLNDATANLTTATAGVFTAAGGGGTSIAADQVLTALTAATKFLNLTLQAVTGTDIFTTNPLYVRIGTPQGGAATVEVRIFGWYGF